MRAVTASSVKVRAHAATIDIVDSRTPASGRREGGNTIVLPNEIFVDGKSLYLPRGSKISMDIDAGESPVEVTMTFFVRRVRVGYADELNGGPGELLEPTAPGTVIPSAWVEAAIWQDEPEDGTRLCDLGLPGETAVWKVHEGDWVRLGVEVGQDEAVVGRVIGNLATTTLTITGPTIADPNQIALSVLSEIERAEALRSQLGTRPRVRVKINATGIGWAVASLLEALRRDGKHDAEIVSVVPSRAASRQKVDAAALQPHRVYDEMWIAGRALMFPHPVSGHGSVRLRVNETTKAQLSGPRLAINPDGYFVVESHKKQKARGLDAPTRAQALLQAVYEPEELDWSDDEQEPERDQVGVGAGQEPAVAGDTAQGQEAQV